MVGGKKEKDERGACEEHALRRGSHPTSGLAECARENGAGRAASPFLAYRLIGYVLRSL
jgi:hypothetical protein